jgi:hypothetical protein
MNRTTLFLLRDSLGQDGDRHFADHSESATFHASETFETCEPAWLRAGRRCTKPGQILDGPICALAARFTPRESDDLADQSTAHQALHVGFHPVQVTDHLVHCAVLT